MTPYFESLDESKQKLILAHLKCVLKTNEELNLTRINTLKEGILLHIEDSLSALPEIENAPAGLYGDLGSGAGYPGVPLGIATERKTVLVDSRLKKMKVVEEILEEIGVSNQFEVFAGRAELLARRESQKFSVLTARALSKISVLLELASPLLRIGGQLICYKSHVEEEEFENATRVQEQVGMKLCSDRNFVLGNEYYRRILVFEKKGPSNIKLPRQEGMAQKYPL